MNPTESDPFQAHDDWEYNACINNWMAFVELADCYVQSADALVSSASSDHMLLDVHVHAICFLYRHGLELILKDLLWKSDFLSTGIKRFAEQEWKELGRHRLQELWRNGSEKAKQVLAEHFPLDTVEACRVKTLLAQFERYDPDSSSFRYPIIKKKGRSHPTLTHVNINVLCENVRQVYQHLKTLVEFIDYWYDQHSGN